LWQFVFLSPVPPLHKNINCFVFSDDEGKITNGEEAKSLELEGVKAAESGDLDTAIATFTKVINIAPQWASGYNNRAQAYRLKGNTPGVYASPHTLKSSKCKRGQLELSQEARTEILKNITISLTIHTLTPIIVVDNKSMYNLNSDIHNINTRQKLNFHQH
jgi:tetratricopeptide (TPR) repeat protein